MENTATEEVVKKLIVWIESSADFVKGELPDFIEQFMLAAKFKVWFDLTFLCIAFILLACIGLYCAMRIINSNERIESLPLMMGSFIPIVLFFPLVGGFIAEIHNLINIYLAPKVYILSNLKDFLK